MLPVDDLFSPIHLLIVLVIALLVFGPKRLPELGQGLGKSIREFRNATAGLTGGAGEPSQTATTPATRAAGSQPSAATQVVDARLDAAAQPPGGRPTGTDT